jgi:hypothetical protein
MERLRVRLRDGPAPRVRLRQQLLPLGPRAPASLGARRRARAERLGGALQRALLHAAPLRRRRGARCVLVLPERCSLPPRGPPGPAPPRRPPSPPPARGGGPGALRPRPAGALLSPPPGPAGPRPPPSPAFPPRGARRLPGREMLRSLGRHVASRAAAPLARSGALLSREAPGSARPHAARTPPPAARSLAAPSSQRASPWLRLGRSSCS